MYLWRVIQNHPRVWHKCNLVKWIYFIKNYLRGCHRHTTLQTFFKLWSKSFWWSDTFKWNSILSPFPYILLKSILGQFMFFLISSLLSLKSKEYIFLIFLIFSECLKIKTILSFLYNWILYKVIFQLSSKHFSTKNVTLSFLFHSKKTTTAVETSPLFCVRERGSCSLTSNC
jgi:hypothetical protein